MSNDGATSGREQAAQGEVRGGDEVAGGRHQSRGEGRPRAQVLDESLGEPRVTHRGLERADEAPLGGELACPG